MKKKISWFLIFIISIILSSCTQINTDAFKVKSKHIDIANLKDNTQLLEKGYIKRSFELGQFSKLPDWADDLKEKDCKLPYSVNTYTDYETYKAFTNDLLGSNKEVFNSSLLDEKTLFDTQNILVIARRIDSSKYSHICDYLNFKTILNKNYIDARYYQNTAKNYIINFIVDIVAIEKELLSDSNINNKLIINQKNYYDSNEKIRKVPAKTYSSMHIVLDNFFSRYTTYRFFDDYDKFSEYVNEFTNFKIEEFVDEDWFNNHKVLVIYKNSENDAILNYYDINLKKDEMTLSCFWFNGDATSTYQYIDIVFIDDTDIPHVDVDKEYNVTIKKQYEF